MAVEEYASQIRRWAQCGRLLAAVAQDYMCEPSILEKTGLTVQEHQWLTIERYDALVPLVQGTYIMPVVQGYSPCEYAEHLRAYGDRLAYGAWVGVGSVCKRNGSPRQVEAVLLAILAERPDLRLHGFGLKKTALGFDIVSESLVSCDSMAWSLAARYEGRDGNSVAEALKYARVVAQLPVQLSMRL